MPNPLTILPPVQSRGAAYADVLSQILGVHEQNRQAEEAKRQAAEDQRTNAVKAALTPYAGQPQLLTRALALLAPDDRQRAQRAGFGIVAPMESPEQTLDRTRAVAQTNDITGQAPPPTAPIAPSAATPTPSQVPDMPPIGAGGGIGVPPPAATGPTPNEIVDQKVRQFEAIYKHAPAKEQVDQWFQAALLGPQGQVTAAQMASKIVPTAQENIKNAADAQTFNQVTLPKSKADVANLGSEVKYRDTVQTPNTQATTAHTQAETVKAGEEIKALRQSNDPVVKSILGKSLVSDVVTNSQSFFSLSAGEKDLVVRTLHRAPTKLTAEDNNRRSAAVYGNQILDDATRVFDKWKTRGFPINGPVLGRFNSETGKWGDSVMPQIPPELKDEYAGDIAQMRDWLTALPIQEAKALAGGRTAYQVIQAIVSASPSLSKSDAMFKGSVAGMRTRFDQIIDHIDKKPWGGRLPVLDDGTSTATPTDLKAKSNADLFKMVIGGK